MVLEMIRDNSVLFGTSLIRKSPFAEVKICNLYRVVTTILDSGQDEYSYVPIGGILLSSWGKTIGAGALN
jgi:hypothetical protein